MVQIVVALKYIVTDPDNPVNLADLPRDEAIQRIKEAYKDFARHIEVEIKGDMAFISYDEGEASSQESQADDYHSRGTRAARRGQYDIAITNFQKAIELQPDLVTARRDLAMAYMETGNTKAAKRQLVRVMQLQPNDAWAHTIMGNLYLHFEDDLGSAERYYQVAYDLDPDDVYLLNGYASLKAKRKQYQEAKELFERALTIDKNFPHARYALALLSQEQGEWETAAWELRQLLSAPPDPDPRTARVYDEGRRMYLYVNQKMAEAQHAELMQQLHEDIDAYTEGGRYPVVLEEDSTIDYPSIAQIAWVYRRSEHVIKYKPAAPSILPHLVAHEFEHIRMIDEAVGAHRNRLFTTTSDTEEYAQRSVSNDLTKLRQRGLDNAAIADVVGRWVKGLSAQLFNTPLDMTIEYRVFQERPYLYASQLTSLDATIREGAEGLDPSIQQMTPRRIWQANIAMNCAYAHFIDYLFDGATNYRELFRSSGQYHNGEKLFQLWQQMNESYTPGDEYDLVDRFAKELKLDRWYQWTDDWKALSGTQAEPAARKSADQDDLLREREPAAEFYCLAALQKFDGMERREIVSIVSEIAMLGQSGLNYTSSEQKYSLRNMPGEYSGLQLLCYMYVGFQLIDPSVDIGVDLSRPYASAKSLHDLGGTKL